MGFLAWSQCFLNHKGRTPSIMDLSSYQRTHNSEGYYDNLRAGIQFLQKAQTSSGDLRGYYDASNSIWGRGDQLYCWNSPALNAFFSSNPQPPKSPHSCSSSGTMNFSVRSEFQDRKHCKKQENPTPAKNGNRSQPGGQLLRISC